MGEILSSVLGELSGIVLSVPEALWKDVIFHNRTHSTLEQFNMWIEGKDGKIYRQNDQIIHQVGVIQKGERRIAELENLLFQKEKEVRLLREQLKACQLHLARMSSSKRYGR